MVDPRELPLTGRWKEVAALYETGDLWRALDDSRRLDPPRSNSERLFAAALELSAGDVPAMEGHLSGISGDGNETRLAEALRQVVRAVQFEKCGLDLKSSSLTGELLAQSYCLQSQGRLKEALAATEKGAGQSPHFGFALARLAELQFATGRINAAAASIEKALSLSPRHAAAVSIAGFLEAARGRHAQARAAFDRAIALDSALADAWLGRGLVRFHQGDREGGRVDLEAAAALKPNRSVLRSYLGKAFAEENNDRRALEELDRAKARDENDPTAWLYSALIRFRGYELGSAIRDLEESSARNKNRAVFRSEMLLDQDSAVRSANLARIYDQAEMSDVSRRESARAVMSDYANYSAHLNLATSYDATRDPTRFNLRAETVWFNEHLLATLLAPTDAAPLSQSLSQNEYSRLFARNHVGFTSSTEFFSHGEVRQVASQYGNFDRFSYSLDFDGAWSEGARTNNDLARFDWYSRAKFQVTAQDSVLLLTKVQDYESGDNFQRADQSRPRPFYRTKSSQSPLALAGYHREWTPGSHTLFLGGRLESEQTVSDRSVSEIVSRSFPLLNPAVAPFNLEYRNNFEIYTAEANHILQTERHTAILGGRFQQGDFDASADLDAAPLRAATAAAFGRVTTSIGDGDFSRRSAYLYHTWEILDDLRLTGGAAYDEITSPLNYRRPPLESGEIHRRAVLPKGALIYSPLPLFALRGIYAQSLGGVSFDESVTLEPSQLAGFPQSFRTLISESLVGSVEVPRHEVAAIGLDFKLPTRTYISFEGVALESSVDRRIGVFDFRSGRRPPGVPTGTDEELRYEERSARIVLNQILAEEWFAQASYQFTRAELARTLPTLPATATFSRASSQDSDLHRVNGSLLYQRKDGLFARANLIYLRQENVVPGVPLSDDVGFVNLFVGWRFPRLHGDITLGVLNIGDQDYKIHPLTLYEEFPRERSFYLRFRVNL